MPIGDLLAEISGGPGSSSTPTTGTKRKADNDSNGSAPKVVKTRHSEGSVASTVARATNGVSDYQARVASRPAASSVTAKTTSTKPSLPSQPTKTASVPRGPNQPPASNSNRVSRPSSSMPSKSGLASTIKSKPSSTSLASKNVASNRQPPPVVSSADSSRAPKKGSFAEIMARGAKAQQSMGKVGVIQHRAIDKPMTKKERDMAKQDQKSKPKAAAGKPYSGSGRPTGGSTTRDGPRSSVPSQKASSGSTKDGKAGLSKRRPGSSGGEEPEKKIKKSTMATTGYSGTARPQIGSASKKPGSGGQNGSRPKPRHNNGLLAPPRMARRDRYEEEDDEEMDDFIDDDEDEEEMPDPYASRYRYAASDASSDMEAGMSDIDDEERKAERFAREEDKREQALEEKLRREKEERKRRFGQGYR